ncbi:SMAD/FHA domain-containing protein [Pisolithus sp. B1]|nr:SMAD/FHA domain-containing protein [Pisolithus sp. B1]
MSSPARPPRRYDPEERSASRREGDDRGHRGRYESKRGGGDRRWHDGRDRYRDSERERERHREGERGRERRREDGDRRRDYDRPPTRPRRSASPAPRPRSPSPSRHRSRSKSGSAPPEDKAKPNFNPSGLLAAATNTVKLSDGTSTVLKYNEPPEARKPTLGWRLYVFKGKDQVDLLHINRQSAYLLGRDRTVVDILIEHPSCSKQHAVIQHRQVQVKDEFGVSKATIKPFIIDLESTNHTHVNDETIPTTRFYELRASDVIKFGLSDREYVLLHDEAV